MTNVAKWMSWEGGINLAAVTSPDLQMPNLIVHLGSIASTPLVTLYRLTNAKLLAIL